MRKELGRLLVDSSRTVRKRYLVKRVSPSLKRIVAYHGSVEYKQTGFKPSEDRKYITFTDGFKAGMFKLWGTRDLHFYGLDKINRVRVVRRADGYYAQFLIDPQRCESREPMGKTLGLDVGLYHFYTDSNGETVDNPRYLRSAEKALKRLQRRVSKKFAKPKKKGDRQSNNYKKAKQKLALKHLKVSRQRKDFVVKTARCVVQSADLVAYEDLKVRNMGATFAGEASPAKLAFKNHCLAKSISDASWTMFRGWVEYFGKVFGVATVAVPPHNTSQQCSSCGAIVKKSLSTRTHLCSCGTVLGRDHNAGLNILRIGLTTVGHTGINVWGATFSGEASPEKLA